jgi:bacterioferritin-associated ferredoxin
MGSTKKGAGRDEVVCKCLHVTRADVRRAVEGGARTYKEVRAATGAGSKCGHCKSKVKRCLEECLAELEVSPAEKDLGVATPVPAPEAPRPFLALARGAKEPAGARKVLPHRVYRHFKGDYYLVEGVATDSETGERCVVYRKLYGDGSLWVRPEGMFLSEVDAERHPEARQRWRFELMDIPSAKE